MRPVGWESLLDAYLAERRDMEFMWGTHDCCRFACSGLAAQGLPDPMARVRPYKTDRGAAGAIMRLGGTLDKAATKLSEGIGLVEVAPAFAQRGMPLLGDVETPEGKIEPALGLMALDGITVWFAGDAGLVWRRVADCRRAWGLP